MLDEGETDKVVDNVAERVAVDEGVKDGVNVNDRVNVIERETVAVPVPDVLTVTEFVLDTDREGEGDPDTVAEVDDVDEPERELLTDTL